MLFKNNRDLLKSENLIFTSSKLNEVNPSNRFLFFNNAG